MNEEILAQFSEVMSKELEKIAGVLKDLRGRIEALEAKVVKKAPGRPKNEE